MLAHGEGGEEDAECGESRVLGHSSQQKWLKLKLKLFLIDIKGYQVVVEDVQWLHEQSAHPGSLQEPPS